MTGTPPDPYIDPDDGILTNLVGARTQDQLDRAENDIVPRRAVQLAANPITGRFDLDHLRAIHRHLFGDVYPFAGEIRTVNIYKANDPGSHFFPIERFAMGQAYVFGEIAADNYLRGLERDRFVDRLGYHYDAVNHLHPFREGNGRAQRVFVDQLAAQAGYHLDWTKISARENIAASRAGARGLQALFDTIVTETGTDKSPSPRGAARLAAVDFPDRLPPNPSGPGSSGARPYRAVHPPRSTLRRGDDRGR